MQIIFLIILYISFLSLGFGSSLIGVAWPSIQAEMGLPVSYGGYISTVRTLAVIIVCYLLGKLVARWGTGKVGMYACILMTVAWLGFALAPSYIWLLLSAFPLGFGAGALDSSFNDFMAQNYSASQMNWLQSFWGIGAVVGPLIMSSTVARPGGWRTAFFIITGIEALIALLLIFALPMWKQVAATHAEEKSQTELSSQDYRLHNANLHPIKMPGMGLSMACFFLYNATETSIAMWSATWLGTIRKMSESDASSQVSLYFLGITVARLISGVVAVKLSNDHLLRIGQILLIIGSIMLFLPIPAGISLIVLGVASGPIMPTMIHESPRRFGVLGTSNPVGFQMGTAFLGGTLIAPLVGKICVAFGFQAFPVLLLVMASILLLCNSLLNRTMAHLRNT
ncbi:MAG TPA: MFS transporter [Clostridiaceae bacterium]|nr:MFS transporter [Clostridiaceae bacterium]